MTTDPEPIAADDVAPSLAAAPDAAWTLRVTRRRWDAIDGVSLGRAVSTVLGAWVLLAWSRFGFQGLGAPRAGVRFVLVGVYSWIAMAVLLAVLARLPLGVGPGRPGPTRALQFVGLAHQPLVVGGFMLQFTAIVPIQLLSTAVAASVVLVWFPAMLAAAVGSMFDTGPARAAALTAAIYLSWSATAGWYLFDRLGHLV